MTKWQNKDIDKLTDNELVSANGAISEVENLHNDRIAQKRERHKNVVFGRNPAFEQLKIEITNELTKRGLS